MKMTAVYAAFIALFSQAALADPIPETTYQCFFSDISPTTGLTTITEKISTADGGYRTFQVGDLYGSYYIVSNTDPLVVHLRKKVDGVEQMAESIAYGLPERTDAVLGSGGRFIGRSSCVRLPITPHPNPRTNPPYSSFGNSTRG